MILVRHLAALPKFNFRGGHQSDAACAADPFNTDSCDMKGARQRMTVWTFCAFIA
jgi:hypothetical protein